MLFWWNPKYGGSCEVAFVIIYTSFPQSCPSHIHLSLCILLCFLVCLFLTRMFEYIVLLKMHSESIIEWPNTIYINRGKVTQVLNLKNRCANHAHRIFLQNRRANHRCLQNRREHLRCLLAVLGFLRFLCPGASWALAVPGGAVSQARESLTEGQHKSRRILY